MNLVKPVSGVRVLVSSQRVSQVLAAALTILSLQTAWAFSPTGKFPTGPNAQTTPGDLCTKPTAYRYPEKIKYCDRNVDSSFKNEIIQMYDRQFGYTIENMQRSQFKIDHYIPLCAGGSNERENLWPQHISVYTITDPLEPLICGKMAAGRLSQAKAVEFIKAAKNNLSMVPDIIKTVNRL